MARLENEKVIQLAEQCNAIIAASTDRADDFFRVVGTQFTIAAYTLIATNTQSKLEVQIGKLLDDIKYDIFRNADDCRKRSKVKPS